MKKKDKYAFTPEEAKKQATESNRIYNEKARAEKLASTVEVVFILDRSGSMGGLEDDTIGGFNSMLEKQKNEPGEVIWSTVLFDDRHEVIHDRLPIREVSHLTEREYYVRGCTALLDAIGRAIHHIGNVHKYSKNADVPEKTLFVITTDGMENSSVEYNYHQVKKMIDRETEKHGWEFIFLGANMDAVDVAGKIGIRPVFSATYHNDDDGIAMNYCAIDSALSGLRKRGTIDGSALDAVRKDYKSRKK